MDVNFGEALHNDPPSCEESESRSSGVEAKNAWNLKSTSAQTVTTDGHTDCH